MRNFIFVILTVFSLLAVSTCGQKEDAKAKPDVTSQNVKQETREALETASTYAQAQIQEYQKQLKARLEQFDRKLDKLQARAETIKAESKTKLNETVAALRQKQQTVREKLQALQSASGKAWEDAKAGMTAAMEDLEKAYEQAVSRFGAE